MKLLSSFKFLLIKCRREARLVLLLLFSLREYVNVEAPAHERRRPVGNFTAYSVLVHGAIIGYCKRTYKLLFIA